MLRGRNATIPPAPERGRILELTYNTGTYVMHAITTRALRLEFDHVDDRCVEVADPEGNKAGFDVMAVADVEPT